MFDMYQFPFKDLTNDPISDNGSVLASKLVDMSKNYRNYQYSTQVS